MVLWAAVFLGAAGIGAYVAAHTSPFPPDVASATGGDPAPGSPSASGAGAATWTGVIRSTSFHDLYVGGRCSTRWVTDLAFDLLDGGRIQGAGTARLIGDRVCTFSNAQVNVQAIEVTVGGSWDAGGFRIRLGAGDRTPVGTTDYGGFESTVFAGGSGSEFVARLDSAGTASGSVRLEREDDQKRGRYVSLNRVSLKMVA